MTLAGSRGAVPGPSLHDVIIAVITKGADAKATRIIFLASTGMLSAIRFIAFPLLNCYRVRIAEVNQVSG
jgi:energy-converting hydrogenase Eha subunit E